MTTLWVWTHRRSTQAVCRLSILTISDLKKTDSAEHRFTFQSNSLNWGTDLHGTTLTVTALQVQVIRTSVSQNTTYAELKCHSSCTPAASDGYIWFRNGQRVDHGKYTYKGSIYPADNISCAFSHHEEHRAPEVYAPVSPSVSAEPSGDIFEGNHVTLKCSSKANPPANNTWYKKTKSSTLQPLSGDSRFSLRSIQSSDSGEYCCVARNQLGESHSIFLNVDVKYAPKRAEVSLSTTDVVEGISLSLTCRGDGNPAPFYTWYRDNQTMLQGQGGVYQFPSVRSEDSGTYHCKAENKYGPVNSTSVHINVEYSPRLPSVSVDPPGEVAVGSSVNLRCSSVANPAATYTWYKEDMTSPAADGHVFTIVDIRHEHAGNYYCQARNSRGHINSIPHLIVVSIWGVLSQ
ncbi:B-cell receptor CD22-like [Fundulus heteroclitus]|uniref:B-cell receptor CD22-like n=1 Tax=Fundulus heteroclitus TaxID=8078 RepID=UPI00165CD819|nr:B-cell receptor CD22-like [Fundulus heteroclitus]